MSKPIFRLFKLGLNLAYEEAYTRAGINNLTHSIEREAGTLAMYVNHVKGDKSRQIVAELYADDEAYQKHISSPHFKAFAEVAGRVLTSREVIHLEPQTLLEKGDPLRVFEADSLTVRLAHVTVTDSQAFADIVLPEMQTSMKKEAGVLVMYAGTELDNPRSWYFYEIYADDTAYENHCQTQHFKAYLADSAPLLRDKNLQELSASCLVNRGSRPD